MSDELRNGNPTADRGLARLYREAAREQPPAHLDAAILAAAHRDVGAGPRPLGSPWLHSWRLPVSIATVVVLSASVVLLMVEEGGEPFTEPPRSVTKAVPEKPDEAADQATALSNPAAPTPPASTPASEPSVVRETTGETRLAKNGVAPRDDASERPDEAPRSARLRSPQPESTRESAPGRIGIRGLSERAPPAPSGSVVPQAASPAPAAKPGSARRQSAMVRDYEHQAPEKWLEKIDELKRDGKTTEADDMLAEFKKRFPEHPLPARLR